MEAAVAGLPLRMGQQYVVAPMLLEVALQQEAVPFLPVVVEQLLEAALQPAVGLF